MQKDPFKEYIKQTEPEKRDKGYVWNTAIGLQAVDGLKPSKYLIDAAIRNIEGDISIHKYLFTGIYKHAGQIRKYNITKKEWILDGATVLYGSASELRTTLEYDISEEKEFSYKGLVMDEVITYLATFVSRLWQIHIFGEGNTRTTAVFFIKYLRTLGFDVTNDIFAENAWYFRNALVRAKYNDIRNGIYETTGYLELFLRNLLLDENNELHNRSMHISGAFDAKPKADIQSIKPDIDRTKADIQRKLSDIGNGVRGKTISHVLALYDECGKDKIFGRTVVEVVTGLKKSRSSELLKILLENNIIVPVRGQGKGKYRFI